MRIYLALVTAIGTMAISASAQTQGAKQPLPIEIDLSNFKYTPDTITLKHGQPYILHLVNKASGGHDFVARRFFAAAAVAPKSQQLVDDGKVELHGGGTADLELVAPAAGRYKVHCSHFMHSVFGMKAEIIVQ